MISFLALIEVCELFAFKTTVIQLIIQQDNGLLTRTGWQYSFQFINWITSAIVENASLKRSKATAMLDVGNRGFLSLFISSLFSLFSLLICVFGIFFFRNLFVFWEICFCFCKMNCVLGKLFSFWEINLCFEKLIYVLGKWFVFWVIV